MITPALKDSQKIMKAMAVYFLYWNYSNMSDLFKSFVYLLNLLCVKHSSLMKRHLYISQDRASRPEMYRMIRFR